MQRFRSMKTLQKFSSVHAQVHNQFNQERHLVAWQVYKQRRSIALTEWRARAGYLRQNWLSNTVFENYDAIVDAACAARRKLIAQPETIMSIEYETGRIGQPL